MAPSTGSELESGAATGLPNNVAGELVLELPNNVEEESAPLVLAPKRLELVSVLAPKMLDDESAVFAAPNNVLPPKGELFDFSAPPKMDSLAPAAAGEPVPPKMLEPDVELVPKRPPVLGVPNTAPKIIYNTVLSKSLNVRFF